MATFRNQPTDSYALGAAPPEVRWTVVRGDSAAFFTVNLTSSQSELLETGDIFDIQLTELLSEGRVWTVAKGSMVILEDVTQ